MIDLISVPFQVKDVLDVSFTLGGRIDPLDISQLIPGGVIHVDRAGGYYKIDLWLKNLVMHGLSQLHMEKVNSIFSEWVFTISFLYLKVEVFRSSDLKQMEIAVRLGLGDLTIDGLYNSTGHLGTVWLQIPLDSKGDKPFKTVLRNATLVPQITLNAQAACDPEGSLRITDFNVPLLYGGVVSKFDNLDQAWETIIQGLLIFIIESQNMIFVGALRGFLASTISNIMCPP